MALPQVVIKTYSRRHSRQTDASHAERTFDEVFHGTSRSPARAAATAEKWGSASFKRISNATCTSPKRRLSPTCDSDDPFSFDSDDDNIAKKSRKENVRQKVSSGAATKQMAGVSDGRHSVGRKCTVGEKSRGRMMNFEEKSSADKQDPPSSRDSESYGRRCTEKITRCQAAVKAKLKTVDGADGERNGLSVYCLSTARTTGKGDALETKTSDRKCLSEGDKKRHCPADGSTETVSPCKTTEQLKVFVDNFSQLISSQRSASRRSDDVRLSCGDQQAVIKTSKSYENCSVNLGHLQSSTLRRVPVGHDTRRRVSSLKAETGLSSSALQRSKQSEQNSDNDDDDDDASIVLLSPTSQKPDATRVGSTNRARQTSEISSTTCCWDMTNSRSASNRVSTLRCSASARDRSEAGKLGQFRSRRRRKSDELPAHDTQDSESAATNRPTSTTATATAAVSTTTTARRLLTGTRKSTMRTKAVYNPRQWNSSEELSASQLSSADSCVSVLAAHSSSSMSASVSASSYDDTDTDMQTPPISTSSRHVVSSASSQSSTGSAKVKVSRDQKTLYTVVRNVKEAHECQEYGETQEFCDDIEYILDGLSDTQPVPTRCLSAVSLASKCSTSAFRMHIRADDTFMKMLSSLHDAPEDPRLALCTSAVMYMMSRDHLAMHIDAASLQLMLRLLSVDVLQSTADDDLSRIRLRLHDIVHQTGGPTSVRLDNMTPGHLVMETLLSLTSKQAGDWFKDTLRRLGGLDQLVNTVDRCVEKLDSLRVSLLLQNEQLHRVERCIRVLERVTYLNTDNQNYLLSLNSATLIRSVHRLVRLCVSHLPSCVPAVSEHCDANRHDDSVSDTSVVSMCLLTSLRLLLNVTHDNNTACTVIGGVDGLLETVLVCTLQSPQYVSTVSRFDLVILGVGLLTNLVENCDVNRERLIQVECPPPSDCQYLLTDDVTDCLEALGMLFSVRYEAAKLIEEEQEAEMEEAERRKAVTDVTRDQSQTDKSLTDKSQTDKSQTDKSQTDKSLTAGERHSSGSGVGSGGGWHESESGMFWEPCDTSVMDSSSDGLAAMHAARQQAASLSLAASGTTASQDDDENYTKVLHTAGRHMEDSIMAAYIALLIGTLIQHKQDLAEHVRETLPSFSFSPMVQMLSKFLGFMNLTNASGMSASKSIQHVIEILDAC